MRRRCHLRNQAADPAIAGSDTIVTGDTVPDSSPLPRLRGNYSGFLPGELVNQLNDSAASGAGLALVEADGATNRSGLAFVVAIGALLYLGSRSR